jgi:hypothetical protein
LAGGTQLGQDEVGVRLGVLLLPRPAADDNAGIGQGDDAFGAGEADGGTQFDRSVVRCAERVIGRPVRHEAPDRHPLVVHDITARAGDDDPTLRIDRDTAADRVAGNGHPSALAKRPVWRPIRVQAGETGGVVERAAVIQRAGNHDAAVTLDSDVVNVGEVVIARERNVRDASGAERRIELAVTGQAHDAKALDRAGRARRRKHAARACNEDLSVGLQFDCRGVAE